MVWPIKLTLNRDDRFVLPGSFFFFLLPHQRSGKRHLYIDHLLIYLTKVLFVNVYQLSLDSLRFKIFLLPQTQICKVGEGQGCIRMQWP